MKKSDLLKKKQELEVAFNAHQQATTQYGLNNHGSPVHQQMEKTLTAMRQEFSRLNDQLFPEENRTHREQELRRERNLHERDQ